MNPKRKDDENGTRTTGFEGFQPAKGPVLRHARSDAHCWTMIASFGEAQLWKDFKKNYELRGGTIEDRRQAMEWVSFFMPEITLKP